MTGSPHEIMIRCSKQSAITITSLGQMVQFLKSKLFVQKGSTIGMMF